MSVTSLLVSDESLLRFREKLDLSLTKEILVFRDIDEFGEVVLVLRFPSYAAADRAWSQRETIINCSQSLGLAKKIVLTVKGKEYADVSLNLRRWGERRLIEPKVIINLIFDSQVSHKFIQFLDNLSRRSI